MKARLPSVTFTSFAGRLAGEQEDTLIHFTFDQSTVSSGDALALRPKIAAAIRSLTLIDDFAQSLGEYATRGIADAVRLEERFAVKEVAQQTTTQAKK